MIGEAVGLPVAKADQCREAVLYVHEFALRGARLSWLAEGEEACIASMLGTPIDPLVIQDAGSVNEALLNIAVNLSAATTARLHACHRRSSAQSPPLAVARGTGVADARRGGGERAETGSGSAADEAETEVLPASLEVLPSSLLQLILCFCGSTRAADALGCVSRALRAHDSPAGGELLYPVFSPPVFPGSCSPSVVSYDERTGLLRKTPRLGNPLVMFGEPVRPSVRRGGLLEIQVHCLPSVGGIQLGVSGTSAAQQQQGGGSTTGSARFWFDGAGRVHVLDGPRCEVLSVLGEPLREGDRLGATIFTLPHSLGCSTFLAFVLNGALMGSPFPLPARRAVVAWRFFVRFDAVEGTAAAVVRTAGGGRRAPLALSPLLGSRGSYTPRTRPLLRPADACGATLWHGAVIVRTVGPDSRGLLVDSAPHRHPADMTLAEVAAAVAAQLICDAWHQVEMRIGKAIVRWSPDRPLVLVSGQVGAAATDPSRWRLRDFGVEFDPGTDCQTRDIFASLPHLIS